MRRSTALAVAAATVMMMSAGSAVHAGPATSLTPLETIVQAQSGTLHEVGHRRWHHHHRCHVVKRCWIGKWGVRRCSFVRRCW